ncbi:ZIP family metal transporter [Paenibacillus antri]|nr:ZIP family metal transporter [Paenibacillus antri]
MALSAGLLLAIAILDFVPESLEHNSFSPIFILIGIIGMYLFQHFVAGHFHFGEEAHVPKHRKSTVVGTIAGMLIHTFFDGFSIAASFTVDFRVGITVFISIFLHKIPDGITISSIIYVFTRNRNKALHAALLLGVSTVAGAIIATLLSNYFVPSEQIVAVAIAFSAGIFIYVALTDLLPAVNATGDRLASSFFFVGVSLYFLLSWVIQSLTPALH